MSTPASRGDLSALILRQLGSPVINIEVSDDQINDAIDLAYALFLDYHYDATFATYLPIQITQQHIDQNFVTLPDNVIGVTQVFPMSSAISGSGLFSVRYQFAAVDIISASLDSSLVPYYFAMLNLSQIEEFLIGETPIRFNKYMGNLYIDTDWTSLAVGSYILVDCSQVVDPAVYTKIWADRWLIKYATALVKKQWGGNLSKFSSMTLPGNVQFNGKDIYNEAVEEIRLMEAKLITGYALPVLDMIR
jgi:hypothetical protein